MYKSYKTELNPTDEQKLIIEQYFQLCIKAHNSFVELNIHNLEDGHLLLNAFSYMKEIQDNKLKDPDLKAFLLSKYKTAVKETLKNAERTFKKYERKQSNLPKLKKQGTQNVSLYFSAKSVDSYYIPCERHRIRIPYIGWIRLKEKGYIPYKGTKKYVISGWIKKSAGRYYVSALVDEKEETFKPREFTRGIGIDLNVNNFATISDGTVYENINKTNSVKKLEKSIARQSRCLSRKYIELKKLPKLKQEVADKKNIYKQRHKLDVLYKRLRNVRRDYLNKCIKDIVDKNPEFIAVEDLKVKEMISEKRFAKFIAPEMFYDFRETLRKQCRARGIEFRLVNKWFPSSHICHECGARFRKLSLSERTFTCPECNMEIERDFNASLNIRDTKDYFTWS